MYHGNTTDSKIRVLFNIVAWTSITFKLKMVEPARNKSKAATVYSTNYDDGWERLYQVGLVN